MGNSSGTELFTSMCPIVMGNSSGTKSLQCA